MPAVAPITPPTRPIAVDSTRNRVAMCRRLAPTARRSPISPTRSSTDTSVTLAMPMAPTSSDTAPRMRNGEFASLATRLRKASGDGGVRTEDFGRMIAPSRLLWAGEVRLNSHHDKRPAAEEHHRLPLHWVDPQLSRRIGAQRDQVVGSRLATRVKPACPRATRPCQRPAGPARRQPRRPENRCGHDGRSLREAPHSSLTMATMHRSMTPMPSSTHHHNARKGQKTLGGGENYLGGGGAPSRLMAQSGCPHLTPIPGGRLL